MKTKNETLKALRAIGAIDHMEAHFVSLIFGDADTYTTLLRRKRILTGIVLALSLTLGGCMLYVLNVLEAPVGKTIVSAAVVALVPWAFYWTASHTSFGPVRQFQKSVEQLEAIVTEAKREVILAAAPGFQESVASPLHALGNLLEKIGREAAERAESIQRTTADRKRLEQRVRLKRIIRSVVEMGPQVELAIASGIQNPMRVWRSPFTWPGKQVANSYQGGKPHTPPHRF
jgi:hypothetical protein